jgi:hypothetical protein
MRKTRYRFAAATSIAVFFFADAVALLGAESLTRKGNFTRGNVQNGTLACQHYETSKGKEQLAGEFTLKP